MRKIGGLTLLALLAKVLLLTKVSPVIAEPFVAGLNAIDRKHYATAFRSFRSLAEQGAAEAQNNIGFLYQNGFGVRRSYANAITWYTRAADQGLPQAEHNLGMLNYHGHGVSQNFTIAKRWFSRAAKQNLGPSHYMLGRIFYKGESTAENPERARTHFRDGAKLGDARSQYMYSYMLLAGEGKQDINENSRFGPLFNQQGATEEEYKLALVWSKLSARNGYEDAKELVEYARLHVDRDEIDVTEMIVERCIETEYKNCPAI
ncbi:MAG: hypothetical protein CMQ40_00540 [Gammaproteobacteria bacterium]|nr:hypothetical protein [Gammaproteobacteria bacterium]